MWVSRWRLQSPASLQNSRVHQSIVVVLHIFQKGTEICVCQSLKPTAVTESAGYSLTLRVAEPVCTDTQSLETMFVVRFRSISAPGFCSTQQSRSGFISNRGLDSFPSVRCSPAWKFWGTKVAVTVLHTSRYNSSLVLSGQWTPAQAQPWGNWDPIAQQELLGLFALDFASHKDASK